MLTLCTDLPDSPYFTVYACTPIYYALFYPRCLISLCVCIHKHIPYFTVCIYTHQNIPYLSVCACTPVYHVLVYIREKWFVLEMTWPATDTAVLIFLFDIIIRLYLIPLHVLACVYCVYTSLCVLWCFPCMQHASQLSSNPRS